MSLCNMWALVCISSYSEGYWPFIFNLAKPLPSYTMVHYLGGLYRRYPAFAMRRWLYISLYKFLYSICL